MSEAANEAAVAQPELSVDVKEEEGFGTLGLGENVLKAVADTGYVTPTPIQRQAIPLVLQGADIIGVAQTGTGKTAGFTLPMIDILSRGRARARMPRSLILEPTRELAAQVSENFETYGKHSRLAKALLIGGVSFSDQEARLNRGVDVLIATPGRLLDHFGRGKVLLADIRILVIDEADRMLDMGFIPDIERIIKLLPQQRQTLMFSATMPNEIRRLADAYMTFPRRVEASRPATTAEGVEELLVRVPGGFTEKRAALRHLLKTQNVTTGLVFCNRKRDVDVVHKSLNRHGIEAGVLHGDMQQSQRMETLAGFRDDTIKLLIASDVAARGLDIPRVSHVFNFDVPYNAEDYVHRIGRTGRAGRKGVAFTLATSEDEKAVRAIEALIEHKLTVFEADGLDEALAEVEHRARRAPAGRRAPPRRAPARRTKPVVTEAQTRETQTRETQTHETQARESEKQAQTRETRTRETEPRGAQTRETEPREAQAHETQTRETEPRGAQARESEKQAPDTPRKRRAAPAKERAEHRRETPDRDESVVGMGDHVPAFLRR